MDAAAVATPPRRKTTSRTKPQGLRSNIQQSMYRKAAGRGVAERYSGGDADPGRGSSLGLACIRAKAAVTRSCLVTRSRKTRNVQMLRALQKMNVSEMGLRCNAFQSRSRIYEARRDHGRLRRSNQLRS